MAPTPRPFQAQHLKRVKLKIKIKSASNLRAADMSLFAQGTSDPFVKCRIKDRPHTEFKTRRIDKSLNPVWDEEHWIEDCKPGDVLEFDVFDWDQLKPSGDFLGSATLGYEEYINGYGESDPLTLDDPTRAKGKEKVKSTLNVDVQVEEYPDPPDDRVRCVVKMIQAKKPKALP